MIVERTPKRNAMFWEKVNIVEDENSCWPWIGALKENGYGLLCVTFDGKQKFLYAHRVSFEWEYGEIPEGLVIRHKCDNPQCVRPSHLVGGTHADNTKDKMERGRYVSGVATITPADVITIRQRRAKGETAKSIAPDYNFTPQHISNICTGVYWPEVGGPLTRRFEITRAEAMAILQDTKTEMKNKEIAAKHGVSTSLVKILKTGNHKYKLE